MKCENSEAQVKNKRIANYFNSIFPMSFGWELLIHGFPKKKKKLINYKATSSVTSVRHPRSSPKTSSVLNLLKQSSNSSRSSFSVTSWLAFCHFLHFVFCPSTSVITNLPWVVIPALLQKPSQCTCRNKNMTQQVIFNKEKRNRKWYICTMNIIEHWLGISWLRQSLQNNNALIELHLAFCF